MIMQYSTLYVEDKQRAMASWEKRWANFVEEVANSDIGIEAQLTLVASDYFTLSLVLGIHYVAK